MSMAKTVSITSGAETRALSSRRKLFGGAAAVVLGGGITAGVAANATDLVPSEGVDAVLLALCARAEEQDRLLREDDGRQRELTGRAARALRDKSDTHFDNFVALAEQAAVIPALTVAGMRAKARVLFLNMDTQVKPGGLTWHILRDLGWEA